MYSYSRLRAVTVWPLWNSDAVQILDADLKFLKALLQGEDTMTSPHILIVDDEPPILNLLKDVVLMSCEGARVETAGSGREAFECLCRAEYDVVLSDIQMEGMSGVDLVRETRSLKPSPTIVLMTGDPDLLPAAFESGAYTCLRKPLPWDVLTDVLKRAIEFNGLHKEIERFRDVREFMKDRSGQLWEGIQKETSATQHRMVQMREQEWQEVAAVIPPRVLSNDQGSSTNSRIDRGTA